MYGYKVLSSVVTYAPNSLPTRLDGMVVGPDGLLRLVGLHVHGGKLPDGWAGILAQEAEQARADRAASPFQL
jgi:hypothetical protein